MRGTGIPIRPSEPPIALVLCAILDKISAAPNVIRAKYTPLARIATAPRTSEKTATAVTTATSTSQNDWVTCKYISAEM